MRITHLAVLLCLAAHNGWSQVANQSEALHAEGAAFGYASPTEIGGLKTEIPAIKNLADVLATEQSAWQIRDFTYASGVPLVGNVDIRAGYYPETAGTPFRGNILYLEGLGDSMMNHDPLFSRLSMAGYRIIAFDYMGQGGSEGTMNHTRVLDVVFPSLQISSIAEIVWNRFKKQDPRVGNRKIVMGWSTGGLAGYEMARRNAVDAVILIAPGIHTKIVVGESFKITQGSLTRTDYSKEKNPHIDAIRPESPLLVPLFSKNLIITSLLAQHWRIPSNVKGLVLLSGKDDTYVNGNKTKDTLATNAAYFKVVTYLYCLS